MTALITPHLVALDADLGHDKDAVVRSLAGLVAGAGRATSAEALHADAMAREAQAPTGLPGGIAIPHCRSAAVTEAALGFARLSPPVDFGAPDGPASLAFLIAAPEHGDADHLTLLTALARALVRPEFVASLRAAGSAEEIVALVQEVVAPQPEPVTPAPTPTPAAEQAPRRSLVVISACPTGIAHTYMAADKLAAAARDEGVEVHVETQGSSGSTPLDPAVIRAADAVLFAVDVGVKDQERFAGKPVVRSSTKRAINEPGALVREALAAANDPRAPRVPGGGAGAAAPAAFGPRPSVGAEIRRWLLTGVSYMIPFVAAGGLLIALGFWVGGYQIALGATAQDALTNNSLWNLPAGGLHVYLGALLFMLGKLAFGFLVPALAGYIAYAIADRPGIAPGFTVGVVAATLGAGYLGGLVGGVIAGFVALGLSRLDVPRFVRGLMPVVIIPLAATLVSGGLMFLVLGRPLADATSALTDWLNGLSGTSAVLLGILLGLMMAFDMGGPVNKAAYAFATAGLSGWIADPSQNTGPLVIMATVMAAGMVPPLALALASVVRPKLFTPAERDNGKAAWLLGLAFITEGAIPFAAADPLRVIPSIMVGSATTGAIVAAGDVQLRAPHGGIFVFFAISGLWLFVVALVAGMLVGAVSVVVAKSIGRKPTGADVPEDAVDLAHVPHQTAPAPAAA